MRGAAVPKRGSSRAVTSVRMSRSIVRRSYRGSVVRSRKSRTIEQMAVLERAGGSVLVVELQGALFFGTAETLAGEIAAQMEQPTHQLILDLRRVTPEEDEQAALGTGMLDRDSHQGLDQLAEDDLARECL